MRNPPSPLPEYVRTICSDEVPDVVDTEDLSVTTYSDDNFYHSVEVDGKEMRWERDGLIQASFSASHEMRRESEETLPMRWRKKFPLEIKTGPEATTRNEQRKVMQFLGKNTEYTPLLIRLSIESLPNMFTLTDIETFGD
jgi:hypothetical protein